MQSTRGWRPAGLHRATPGFDHMRDDGVDRQEQRWVRRGDRVAARSEESLDLGGRGGEAGVGIDAGENDQVDRRFACGLAGCAEREARGRRLRRHLHLRDRAEGGLVGWDHGRQDLASLGRLSGHEARRAVGLGCVDPAAFESDGFAPSDADSRGSRGRST